MSSTPRRPATETVGRLRPRRRPVPGWMLLLAAAILLIIAALVLRFALRSHEPPPVASHVAMGLVAVEAYPARAES